MTIHATSPATGAIRSSDQLGDFLTIDEVSDWLQIPKNTLYYWRQRNEGPPGLSVGKHLRFYKPDVLAWMLARA